MKIRSSKSQQAKTTTITTKILGPSELAHYQLLTQSQTQRFAIINIEEFEHHKGGTVK